MDEDIPILEVPVKRIPCRRVSRKELEQAFYEEQREKR